jgi:malate dehydrogenase (oxaloacetate-decarboxylating)
VVIFGAGTAGIGIADQIRDAIAIEGSRSPEAASRQIWTVDRHGIVLDNQLELSDAQRAYARPANDWTPNASLLDVVRTVKPHILIGTSTKPGSFTEEIVREMASHVERPIIFPLSNPTRLHEAFPSDLIAWTDGKVLTATGSPFPPVQHEGISYEIAECNNSEIFPGIGLGAVLCEARLITADLLVAAVKALAAQAPAVRTGKIEAGLLPDVSEVREISVKVAAAVVRLAVKDGLSQREVPTGDEKELEDWIRGQMWQPQYSPLVKV